MATTYKHGAITAAQITTAEKIEDVSPELYWLEPDASPLLHLSGGKDGDGLPPKKEEVTNPEFKVLEKLPHGIWTAINNVSNYTAGDTSLVLDTVEPIRIGYSLKNMRTKEVVRVTNISYGNSTVTIVRAQGVTAAAAMNDNDPLMILGDVSEDYADVPTALSTEIRSRSNYCELIQMPVSIGIVAQNMELYHGKKEEELNTEVWLEYKKAVERKFHFGEPYYSATGGPNGGPIWNTGGAYYWITTGGGTVTTCTTTFTKTAFTAAIAPVFADGSDTKIALCGSTWIEAFEYWKDGKLEMRPSDEFYDLRVAEWITGFGRLILIYDRQLQAAAYGTATYGHAGTMLILDEKSLSQKHMRGLDSALYRDVSKTKPTGHQNVIMGMPGLGFVNPEWCGAILSLSTFS